MSDVAEQTAEVVAENVEEIIDGTVDVLEVARNNVPLLIGVGVGGAVLGGAVGYLVAVKRLGSQFDQRLEDEVAAAKQHYADFNRVDLEGNPITPLDILQRVAPEAAEALTAYSAEDEAADEEIATRLQAKAARTVAEQEALAKAADKTAAVVEVVEESSVNVFTNDAFDLEEEIKHRTPTEPYIITDAEFMENAPNHEQSMYTYYEADDVLADEKEDTVTEPDALVGLDNLVRFGSGSGDPNVVYIRSERVELDFEITRSTGSYATEVLGMPADEPDSRG